MTAEQAALVEQHLRGCAECRLDAELERRLLTATGGTVPLAPAPTASGTDADAGAGNGYGSGEWHGYRAAPPADDGLTHMHSAAGQPDGAPAAPHNHAPDSPQRAIAGLDESLQPDMEAALARLLPRLDSRAPAGLAAAGRPAPWRWRAPAWWRAWSTRRAPWTPWAWSALAAQFVVIAGLAALLAERPAAPPGYRLLGNADTAGANLVVVFKPDTAEHELRRLLRANQARVVGGPTVTDAYLLAVPDPQRARVRLRAESAVLLAEALAAGESP
ncbi:hypothetical protein CSQ96_26440 [Janthinobacterium sp. BJB412]|nr:hypothetical protein CSQ96_26440 [Janthinobacterium sp. BJB412]